MRDPFSKTNHPAILYKYRNFHIDPKRNKSHLTDLINGELFFSNPEIFNDPFDCEIPINYKEFIDNPKSLDKFIADGRTKFPDLFKNESFTTIMQRVRDANTLTNPAFVKNHTQQMQKDLKNSFGIFSATSKNDNLLMWSHYSSSHSGFCYGFDTKQIVDNLNVNSIGKVKYSNKYPIISPLDDGLEQLRLQLLYKAHDWKYEKEYRILLLNKSNSVFKMPLNYIKSIFLGLNISPADKENILSYRTSHFSHAKFYEMTKSENEFKLIPNEI